MNSRREKTVVPSYVPMNQASSFTVEKALSERLDAVRNALVAEAEGNDWDPDAVDRVLLAGGLPTWTNEYIVQFVEETPREVRVRAKDKASASEVVTPPPGARLVAVMEAPE